MLFESIYYTLTSLYSYIYENIACFHTLIYIVTEVLGYDSAFPKLLRGISEAYGVTVATTFLLSVLMLALVVFESLVTLGLRWVKTRLRGQSSQSNSKPLAQVSRLRKLLERFRY